MKQDHRVRLTKMMLRDSFFDLMQEKPVSKITVKELCDRAGVNRATFYSHYADIYALYEEIERELAQTIMHSLKNTIEGGSLEAFSKDICTTIARNEKLCMAFFGEYSDPELLLRIVDTFRERSIAMWRRVKPDLAADELDRFYTFMANGCLAVIRSWVQTGMRESTDDIARFIEKMADSGLAAL
ncbi:TetR/AcrR family transcriptional regulator [Raoultibacter phocaeensis]|uniref:TetR/AcrR family transcriptional regulator n=1 Tax=Raoultibacter phocaeensis TaxID=2479841 RepID=UPI0015D635FF|nr:TetR/AcrR family transcriptional regulator [Raoultibacter phocaeensis]